jgi:REP element-mobilizing transposase RayT
LSCFDAWGCGGNRKIIMEKYQNKYRIKSHRKPNWDYSGNGIYFLCIVTQNRVCNLGNIINKKMILSDYGKIVETEFLKSFKIRKELFLDEFIIMPNHLHTIVVLDKPEIDIDSDGSHGSHVETHGRASLQSTEQSKPQKLIRLPKSISSFMAGFKSVINSKIDDYIDDNQLNIPKYNRNNHFFQSNYYDHIIRNNAEFERIKNYIINNPANWENDKFNTENAQ